MNDAVMLSIRPEWAKKILSGEKTVEVRKSFPGNVYLPFKVYMYETVHSDGPDKGCGAVVGEFTCDEIFDIVWTSTGHKYDYQRGEDCLSVFQLHDYLGAGDGYGWHITKPVTYDSPVPVTDFIHVCSGNGYIGERKPFARCPQSWMYCEER